MEVAAKKPEKAKLREVNPYLTCYLCKGYLIDATTISECLHSFCRSCIIKFLQDNSYCPVCEVIINKAKPNLKLDKTLQDIVYKLVPELFLKEMTRRKAFYQQFPKIAARMPPEERGEDTERTIYNPQDCISLSMEYISDDSSPGAIQIPKQEKTGDDGKDSAMKRYLQCPGMCRVDVLKKFVRNKYNVDTSKFYIDILYKRVPLPDHYTLIDIAYIYAWKRNEPMKFYFRITDLNKLSERFDHFDATKANFEYFPKPPTRRSNGERNKRREGNAARRAVAKLRRATNVPDVAPAVADVPTVANASDGGKTDASGGDDVSGGESRKNEASAKALEVAKEDRVNDIKREPDKSCQENVESKNEEVAAREDIEAEVNSDEKPTVKPPKIDNKEPSGVDVDKTSKPNPQESADSSKPPISATNSIKTEPENVANQKTYTNITLNRTEGVEIITKIQEVQNKEGKPIGHQIVQTVRKGGKVAIPRLPRKIAPKEKPSEVPVQPSEKPQETTAAAPKEDPFEDEKCKFLKSIELTAKTATTINDAVVPSSSNLPETSQKRKISSPVKNEKAAKKPKVERKGTTKIIITQKPSTAQKANLTKKPTIDPGKKATAESAKKPALQVNKKPAVELSKKSSLESRKQMLEPGKKCTKEQVAQKPDLQKRDSGLQSLIDSCRISIPSSLSITIKESGENRLPTPIPPVKNYIEILKLPDEDGKEKSAEKTREKISELASKFRDTDSEQKVDQDLAEIAKSLTEKIPMSTTVSQVLGPKPNFPIPVQNAPKFGSILPCPVPDVVPKIESPKVGKQVGKSSFQKIFEESIKKPVEPPKADAEQQQQGAGKRNLMEIASQLYKKTKLEQEKAQNEGKCEDGVLPKVPIPRLPKTPQTVSNLHSSSLGLNYSVSVGQKSPAKSPKVNGTLSPMTSEEKCDIKPSSSVSSPKPGGSPRPTSKILSPKGCNSPRNSPKSSPMVKHMYAPSPGSTYPQPTITKYQNISPKPANTSPKPKSPSTSTSSKPSNSQNGMTTNEILEKYKIQNLAQVTASLNFNAMTPGNQLAALQHAMLLKHIEMQNRQNWLNMNQGPLLQYEKYLQSLNGGKAHLLGNIKEN